jgi:hypothetical protein
MVSGLSCAASMRALLRLSLHVDIRITCSTRLSLINLVNHLMIDVLALSQLLIAYVHVVPLLFPIMNVLNNCGMLLMTLRGA